METIIFEAESSFELCAPTYEYSKYDRYFVLRNHFFRHPGFGKRLERRELYKLAWMSSFLRDKFGSVLLWMRRANGLFECCLVFGNIND
jgi:hypothetical protein